MFLPSGGPLRFWTTCEIKKKASGMRLTGNRPGLDRGLVARVGAGWILFLRAPTAPRVCVEPGGEFHVAEKGKNL